MEENKKKRKENKNLMIEEFLLLPPFLDQDNFLWHVGICAIVWGYEVKEIT